MHVLYYKKERVCSHTYFDLQTIYFVFVFYFQILAEYNRQIDNKPTRASSLLSDVVLFSGSVAAVAGAVLYLSEKAKAATAAAALVPTALAAMTSVRIGRKVQNDTDSEHFHQIIELLLSDMKRFKQLVRKSLNLLQGMEMITQGNFLSVDPATGASMVSSQNSRGSNNTTTTTKDNQFTQSLDHRTEFPALRHAALKCTLQIIEAYREAVGQLMEISPLAEHVDMQEHYIAFVDMKAFGLEPSSNLEPAAQLPSEMRPPIAIRELKETAQIALVQQSEYLRRFSLAFCERVRDTNVLNKAGVLKHIRDLLVTIRNINCKLSRVLDYHQAMGFDLEKLEQGQSQALMEKPPLVGSGVRGSSSQKFVPLRSIYTSMFSTGLHLQHTLLKLRSLEQVFEAFEKKNHKKTTSRRGRTSPPIPVDEVKLIEWLGSFQEIQAELNACIGCLDNGVSQISSLQQDKCAVANKSAAATSDPTSINEIKETAALSTTQVVRDQDPISPTFDEVFEAILAETDEDTAQEDAVNSRDDFDEVRVEMQNQSNRLMKELKGVLVHKAKEHERREAYAIARQREGAGNGTDPFLLPENGPPVLPSPNQFDDSFVECNLNEGGEGSTSSSSSVSSDCPTVRSVSPKGSRAATAEGRSMMARSISGQLLDSDDEETASESCLATRCSPVMPTMHMSACMEDNHLLTLSVPTVGSGLRSMSTPDLKNMDVLSHTSYKAFVGRSKDESDDEDTSSSSTGSLSGWESADELEANFQPLQSAVSHRRPLRPAAAVATTTSSVQERKKKLRKKRERNRSDIVVDDEAIVTPATPTVNTSTYIRLNGKEDVPLSIPDQRSTGFNGGLAAEVARAALAMRNGTAAASELTFTSEEVIGDSDSDSEVSL